MTAVVFPLEVETTPLTVALWLLLVGWPLVIAGVIAWVYRR